MRNTGSSKRRIRKTLSQWRSGKGGRFVKTKSEPGLHWPEVLEPRQVMAADLLTADPAPMALASFEQTFEQDGERDQLLIHLNLGDMIYADVQTVGGEFRDSLMTVLDPQGNLVAENDDIRDPATQISTSDPAIMYVAERSGTHTIVVQAKPSDEPIEGTTQYRLDIRNYALNEGVVQNMTPQIADGSTMAWLVDDSLFLSDEAGNGVKLKGDWTKHVTIGDDGLPSATYTNNGPIVVDWTLPSVVTEAIEEPAVVGDANGDGQFDPSDLTLVFQSGKYNTGEPATLSEGDFDGDGDFDSADLIAAFRAGPPAFTALAASPLLTQSPAELQGERGLYGEYFQLNFSPSTLNQINFDALTPTHSRIDPVVNFPTTLGDFGGLTGPTLRDNFAARWTGLVYIDTPGEYTFTSGSDDGSRVFINGQLVDNNDGLHAFQENATFQEAVLGSQPLNWYQFNETGNEPLTASGNPVALDRMGRLNGSKIGLDAATGIVDGATRLRESGDRIALNATAVTGSWTAVFVLEDFGNPAGPSDHLMQDNQFSLKLDQFNNSGQLGFTRFGVADYRFSPAARVPRNQPVHVAFVGNPATGVQAYINGVFAGSNPNYIPMPRGTIGTGGTVNVNAEIDEVVLYNRALTAAELQLQSRAIFSDSTATPVTLTRGFHEVRMEFFEAGGGAGARLRWTQPGSDVREVVPSNVLIPTTPEGGFLGEYYQLNAAAANLAAVDFANLEPVHTRIDQSIDFPATTASFGGLGNPALFDQFAARWTGTLFVDTPGEYTFVAAADDQSRVSINGEVVLASPGLHTMNLDAGPHAIAVEFLDNAGPAGVELEWIPPGGTRSSIPNRNLIPGNLQQGIRGDYFQLDFIPSTLNSINFASLEPTLTRVDPQLDVPSSETADNFAVQWNGYVYIDMPGDYEFLAGSGDGSRLYLNDVLIVDNDGDQDFTELSSGPLRLSKGLHRVRMEYFENADGAGARLSWIRPGDSVAEVVSGTHLFHQEVDSSPPDVGQLVLDGQITVSTVANVFGDVAGSVGLLTSDMQVSSGVDPILNYYANEYGLSITTPGTSYGIGLGRDLTFLAAPLRDSGIYIWSRVSQGASVSFGGATVSSGGDTVTTILDPADPFIYTEAGDFRLGISHQGLIPFVPTDRDTNFDEADLDISGHVYARIDDITIPDTPAALRGEIVVDLAANDPIARIPDFGRDDFATMFAEGFVSGIIPNIALGLNGEVRVGLPEDYTGGLFTATIPVGGATLQYIDLLGGLTGAGQAGLAISGGTINPLIGTPFEDLFIAPIQPGFPSNYQYQFSATGTTPLDFARSFRIDVALETGAGSDGISFDIPGVGTINLGAPGERFELGITPESVEMLADSNFLLGTSEMRGNLDLTDGSFYVSASVGGPSFNILDTDIFDAVNSTAIVELGLNGQRPDGSRFTGFGAAVDLSIADISLEGNIDLIGTVGFGIGGSLAGRFDAGVVDGRLAYSGSLEGEAQIRVNLPGDGADFDISHAIDLAFSDAVDEFTIPLPTVNIGAVQVELPDLRVRLSRNAPQVEAGELRIDGIDIGAIAETLRDIYDLTASEVAAVLARAEFAIDEIGGALQRGFGLTAQGAAEALQAGRFVANEISDALAGGYGAAQAEIAGILRTLGYSATDIGNALAHTFTGTAAEVAAVINGIGADVRETAAMLQDVFGQTASEAAAVLRGIGVGANEVSQALRDVYDLAGAQASAILRDIGYGVNEIGNVIAGQFFQPAGAAAEILQDLGYGVADVAGAVQDAFGLGVNQVAGVLSAVGYELSSIVAGLSSITGSLTEVADAVLDELGVTAEQFAAAAQAVGATVTEWSSALLGAGVRVQDVSRALTNVAGQSFSQVSSTLRQLGQDIRGVIAGLSSLPNINLNSLADLLLDAGFSPSAIASNLGASQIGNLVNAFGRRISSNFNVVGNILVQAGLTPGTVAVGFFQNNLPAFFSVNLLNANNFNARQVGSTLTQAGYSIADTVAGMRNSFPTAQVVDMLRFGLGQTSTFNIIPWMINAGFGEADVYVQLQRIGFTAQSLAQVMNQLYRYSDQTVASLLAGAGYASSAIRDAVESAFGTVSGAVDDFLDGACSIFCF